jgi:uncharacterized membrane protein
MSTRRQTSRPPRHDKKSRTARSAADSDGSSPHALEENVHAIKVWERALLSSRSRTEQLGDWIAEAAASGPVLVLHVVWFGLWVTANTGWIPGVPRFDPFPFQFLTMAVSLEAIFLALFVLASQNHLARQADKRSQLDLQIDLLGERETTVMLLLLQDIARHLGVHTSVTPEQLRDLAKKVDLQSLTSQMDENDEPASATPPAPSADRDRRA